MAIPEGWRIAALGSIVTEHGLQTGPFGSQLKASEYSDDGVPVVMPKDMKGGRIATDSIARVSEAIAASRLGLHRVHSGDVLFARRGEIGRCALVSATEVGWICGTGCLRARPGNLVHPSFLVHQLLGEHATRWLTERAVGQTMLNLNTQILSGLPIALPPLPEQKKIAAILSSVDETIAKTEAVIAQLQIVKKAMMEQLLTKGMPGRHTRFKQTEIGEIPEEWEVVPLGALVSESIRNGYSPQCPNESTGKWTLSLGAVGFDGFNPSARKPAPLDDPRVDASELRRGDLLLSRSNTRERVGLVGIYRGDPAPCSYPDLLMRIRLKPHVHAEFLEATLLSNRGRAYFEARARGTSGSMVKVDRGIVEQFIAVVPSLGEQQMICKVLRAIDEDLASERHALLCVQTFKQTLSSSLLSGELRVIPEVAE